MGGLTINRLADRRAALVGPPLLSDRRLYLAADGVTVVEAKDSRAATLFVPVGGEIPRVVAVKHNLGVDAKGKIVLGGSLEDSPADHIMADRRLCLAVDERTVVEETDPAAAVLLVNAGDAIDPDVVAKLGLVVVDGKVQQQKKESEKPRDKERDRGEDKNAGKDGDKKAGDTTKAERKGGIRGFFTGGSK